LGYALNPITQTGVILTPAAQKQASQLEKQGFGRLPVCMAKTQYSFSDDASLLGAPRGFAVTVRNLKVSAGAGFIVALTGDIMTMPGLPKIGSQERQIRSISVFKAGKDKHLIDWRKLDWLTLLTEKQ
jgi:formyltetrahydrofolate synthetase